MSDFKVGDRVVDTRLTAAFQVVEVITELSAGIVVLETLDGRNCHISSTPAATLAPRRVVSA